VFGTTIERHGTALHTTVRWRGIGMAERLRPGRSISVVWEPDVSRDAMLLVGILVGIAQAGGWFAAPVDAIAYWQAGTSTNLYPAAWSEVAAGYLFYPPPVAQLSTLIQPIGFPAFILLFTGATFGAFWYCARRWSLPLVALGIPYFVGIGPDVSGMFLAYALIGNLQWILAALTIMALRHPALWSIELLTKVTTAVGWWWHALRGEWRAAAIGAFASVLIMSTSFALAPDLWFDFGGFVMRNATMANPPIPQFPVPFGVRLATALPILVWGARTNRPWTVPLVVGWSLPAVHTAGFLPFWVAAWRVWSDGRRAS
jgi:hypothetical protein